MYQRRGYHGWMAATTVAVTLALVFLVVEKYLRLPSFIPSTISDAPGENLSEQAPGIYLSVDPRLAGKEEYPRRDVAQIVRDELPEAKEHTKMLRRPPEPAAAVVLRAPIATQDFATLPLHSSRGEIDYLMDAMDSAFDSKMNVVSAQTAITSQQSDEPSVRGLENNRLPGLPSPASLTGRIPKPESLIEDLKQIQALITNRASEVVPLSSMLVAHTFVNINSAEASTINLWATDIQQTLDRVINYHGLENPDSVQDINQLVGLASQATEIGNSLSDYPLAARVIRAGYSLQRRVQVWRGIQQCLDGTTIDLGKARSQLVSREDLSSAIAATRTKLEVTGDADGWNKYLLLDELDQWVNSSQDIWAVGNDLAINVLSRLQWQRLSTEQSELLSEPEFSKLASHLMVWGRDPIDYRRLLVEIEELEKDPISRVNASLAGAVQVLRLSDSEKQRQLAASINDHYRNANMRLSITSSLLERLMPETDFEVRPVRQRILGASTRGASSVKTNLSIKLRPDKGAWNVGIGVLGDMYSNTSSSKGPAVFHNTSTAQIHSMRYVRVDPTGYRISAEPTNVTSQDRLRRMSTDYDGLPVVGSFIRVLVREQFDQKKGLAQRISRRIIARETDSELDKRLSESLANAEKQLQERLVGPLENFNLNPMVVSMQTTDQRLAIRYRVANEGQMAAHTPRPRAPRESLMSVQLNQTAINNAIAQIGLSGKKWALPELYKHLGQVFQNGDWEIPDELPEAQNLFIRFADTRPVSVEMKDGKLRLTLRIAELSQPGRFNLQRFIVSTNYTPIADGLKAELVRDEGDMAVISRRDRFKIRVIFAKVFVSKPQIELISRSLTEDPRAEGLAVSQLEITDGWLAVAISEQDSEMATEVAAKASEFKSR